MTDKKIVIDGADVSPCKQFDNTRNGFNEDGELEEGACYNNPMVNEYGEIIAYRTCRGINCVFKQRYKQERNKQQLDRLITKLDNILGGLKADMVETANEYNEPCLQDVYILDEDQKEGLTAVLNQLEKIKDSL